MPLRKLKKRWGVKHTWQVIVILLVFSLAGTSILFVKEPFFHLIHLPPDTSLWIKIPLTVLVYQVLLLAWGALLGHFRFFWEKEKRLFRFLGRLLFGWMLPKSRA